MPVLDPAVKKFLADNGRTGGLVKGECKKRGGKKYYADLRLKGAAAREKKITIKGETLCLAAWARRVGITPTAFRDRIAAGWTEDELLEPKKK